jgi:hypothetical protein
MKITLKIQSIEITIEDEALAAGAAPAAILTATVQSLEQVVAPLITPHANGKVVTPRKSRAAAPTPETKDQRPETTVAPLPPAIDITEPPATAQLNGHAARENAEEAPKPAEPTTQTPENAEESPKTEEPTTPTTETPKKRLPFEEFDKLVRSEMKRLAPIPGTMPGHTLWNELRDPQLPTMGAVVSRYDCTDLKGLAALLNLNPPISKPGPVSKQ